MKAIILAAGRGSRMGALTSELPKCLTKLGGTTLLERQLAAISAAGISDIAIVTGYQKQHLQPFVRHTFENPRWSETNMVMSLRCAEEWLRNDRCVVSYSDIFYDTAAVTSLAGNQHDISITYDVNWLKLWSQRFADPLSDAETFSCNPDGTVAQIGGKASSIHEINGQYMGLLGLSPAGWARFESLLSQLTPAERDRLDITTTLARVIAGGVSVHAVPYSGTWGEVDSAQDLALYEEQLASGELVL
jgi:choline kinase